MDRHVQDRDWAAAERHFSQALALDSSDVPDLSPVPAYLAATGRMEEGLAIARRATAVDPVLQYHRDGGRPPSLLEPAL
jgi:hypothetical protein